MAEDKTPQDKNEAEGDAEASPELTPELSTLLAADRTEDESAIPQALDAAILQQARAAVSENENVKNQAADSTPPPESSAPQPSSHSTSNVKRFERRWAIPLSLAATIVITVLIFVDNQPQINDIEWSEPASNEVPERESSDAKLSSPEPAPTLILEPRTLQEEAESIATDALETRERRQTAPKTQISSNKSVTANAIKKQPSLDQRVLPGALKSKASGNDPVSPVAKGTSKSRDDAYTLQDQLLDPPPQPAATASHLDMPSKEAARPAPDEKYRLEQQRDESIQLNRPNSNRERQSVDTKERITAQAANEHGLSAEEWLNHIGQLAELQELQQAREELEAFKDRFPDYSLTDFCQRYPQACVLNGD